MEIRKISVDRLLPAKYNPRKDLQPGEKLLVDPGHVAAMEETVDFDIERVKGAKNILFGEGLFFSKITGPGKVWLQTMPISKLAEAIIPFLPEPKNVEF